MAALVEVPEGRLVNEGPGAGTQADGGRVADDRASNAHPNKHQGRRNVEGLPESVNDAQEGAALQTADGAKQGHEENRAKRRNANLKGNH